MVVQVVEAVEVVVKKVVQVEVKKMKLELVVV